jgi:hypothetical protein
MQKEEQGSVFRAGFPIENVETIDAHGVIRNLTMIRGVT